MGKTMGNGEIGDRIRKLRREKGYSMDEFAASANISSKFLYEIEIKHVGFSINTLNEFSNILDVSSDYILYGENGTSKIERLKALINKTDLDNQNKIEELIKAAYDLSHNTDQ